MLNPRIIVGSAIWLILISGLGYLVFGPKSPSAEKAQSQIWTYASQSRTEIELQGDREYWFAIGDPIFLVDENGKYERIGEITKLHAEEATSRPTYAESADAIIYSNAPKLNRNYQFTIHETPVSLEWIINEMLPPEVKKEMAQELAETVRQNQSEIVSKFNPIFS